ncbi:MAG: polyprenyl synthetase family protein [Mariprofundales bacterium]|nr:polyprenyl synthetase family protein [Mariprofundales bacterium]
MQSDPLQRAVQLCAADMDEVNRCIVDNLQSDIVMIPAIGQYIINSGGKRLRPLISLLIAQLFGYRGSRHIMLATVIEFIHTASLLHDDVVDGARERRGEPSANGVWGNQASVLVGDYLFSRSFQMMVEAGDLMLLKVMSDVTNALAEGEVLQLSRTFHLEMTEAECLEVIERKTAVLFRAAAEVTASVAGQESAVFARVSEYGMCLGVAFQLMDDALDYSAEGSVAGKPVGHDLEEGKITLPLIFAMREDRELRQRVEEIADRDGYQDGDREWVRERVRRLHGAEQTVERAYDYAQRAVRALQEVEGSNSEIRELLQQLALFAAQREY